MVQEKMFLVINKLENLMKSKCIWLYVEFGFMWSLQDYNYDLYVAERSEEMSQTN